ncbi:hypothetical protein PsorP6_014314 [Peronosclerospora sorghi]|uniref:Uncharacterized protein n=1 Tax=Peronosclerospora sorghi TaxID=230839 RepID=A0ACC0VGM3_9STRA|nr:hypothetical protein PsorP6_014314 [Peronosclerospora sorghi]
MDDEAVRYEDKNERSSSDCRQVLGFSRSTLDSTSSELDGESLALSEHFWTNLVKETCLHLEEAVRSNSLIQTPRVLRVLREIQVNNVELAMEWLLRHLEDEDDAIDDSQHNVAQNDGGDSEAVNLCQEKESARGNEMKEDLQTLYCSLRDNFEAVCFQILRFQATKNQSDDVTHVKDAEDSSKLYPSQNLVTIIAQHFSFLILRSNEDRHLVIHGLNTAILDYFDEAPVLQLDSESWEVLQLQSPSCIGKLLAHVISDVISETRSLKVSWTSVILDFDAIVAGSATKPLLTVGSASFDHLR